MEMECADGDTWRICPILCSSKHWHRWEFVLYRTQTAGVDLPLILWQVGITDAHDWNFFIPCSCTTGGREESSGTLFDFV